MTGIVLRRMLRRAVTQVRHVTPVQPGTAQGLVAQVYAQVERDFGMLAPPVALHSPSPEVLAASWLMLRESLLTERPGREAGRAARETVAAAVSLANACPYCVDVHGSTLHGLISGEDALAIAGDRISSVTDRGLRDLAAWARGSGTGQAVLAAFPAEQTAEFVGIAVTFHYLNRMVNVFLGESPLPPEVPGPVRDGLLRLLGRIALPGPGRSPRSGDSLALLPAAPGLPGDLSWAADDLVIAEAFARAAWAIEGAGGRSVPEPVQDLVLAELSGWDGAPAGLYRAEADRLAALLDPALRPAARLALLTARASYQVTHADIEAFQAGHPGDVALVELTSWASLTAARRIGARLGEHIRRQPMPTPPAGSGGRTGKSISPFREETSS